MSAKSSKSRRGARAVVGYVVWVAAAFIAAQLLAVGLFLGLKSIGVPITGLKPAILQTLLATVSYLLALLLTIGLPWWLLKRTTDRKILGLGRLPAWQDIGLGPLALIPYLILSGILTYLASQLLPGFQANQAQDVGFQNLVGQSSLLLAFLTLVILAPLAEETLFRGYLYGRIRKHTSIVAASLITSLCFAVLHFQLNVGVDVFALSLVLCGLREMTGSIWAGILLHMSKNALAFYLLFVGPMIH